MKIKKIEIKNLYGNNYEISFNEDLSILYGVNGSGKTTILNIIYYVMSGNIEGILQYEFEDISIKFSNKYIKISNFDGEIIIDNGDEKFSFSEKEILFSYKRNKNMHMDINKYNFEKTDDYYVESSIDLDLMNIELKQLFELTYIPLDRRVKGLKTDAKFRVNEVLRNEEIGIDQLNIVIHQANEYYKNYEEQILRKERGVQALLEDKMLESLAEPITDINVFNYATSAEKDVEAILEIRNKLLENKNTKITKNINKLIKMYQSADQKIDKLFKNKKRTEDIDTTEALNQIIRREMAFFQIKKLEDVNNIVEPHQKYLNETRLSLNETLKNINLLLADTYKEIYYDERVGLCVNNKLTNKNVELSALSSGEKQLVIFLVFSLIRNQEEGENKVIIIDEPELSMHIAWQEKILGLMTECSNGTQMIVATHSPDIIGENIGKCIEVKPIW